MRSRGFASGASYQEVNIDQMRSQVKGSNLRRGVLRLDVEENLHVEEALSDFAVDRPEEVQRQG